MRGGDFVSGQPQSMDAIVGNAGLIHAEPKWRNSCCQDSSLHKFRGFSRVSGDAASPEIATIHHIQSLELLGGKQNLVVRLLTAIGTMIFDRFGDSIEDMIENSTAMAVGFIRWTGCDVVECLFTFVSGAIRIRVHGLNSSMFGFLVSRVNGFRWSVAISPVACLPEYLNS